MRIARLALFAALLATLFMTTPLVAQVATGTIAGTVEDSSGRLVPGATVVALHVATGDARRTITNERGEYQIPFAKIGEYSLSAEAPGFKRKSLSGITLRVDQTATLRIGLDVGTVTETVQVTASAPLVDSTTTSLGQVIENRKIVELPLNGRNPFALGLLAGNTVPVSGMATNMPFVAGGGRFASNDVLLDGIDNNTVVNNGSIGRNGIAYTPSVDAVEEFKVKTNNFSAEFGRSAGAIVSANFKSGTNEFHGSAWEFLRNEKFDANNFFSNANRIPRQPFKQNQFGFTVGGPVVIPKLYNGRNRTFFFGDYDATRRRTSASSSLLDIPPLDFRRGDFSRYNRTIYDPRTRVIGPNGAVVATPFPGNIIPRELINPSSAAILALLPEPNAGEPGAQARNYLRIAPRGFDNDQFDIKIDHRFSDSNTLSGRFSRGDANSPNPGNFDGFIGAGTDSVNNPRSVVVSDVHVLSPTTVNEARFGWLRRDSSIRARGLAEGVEFARANNIALLDFPQQAFPDIQFTVTGIQASGSQFTSLGGAENNLNIENTYHAANNLSHQRGAHGLKFGGEVRRYHYDRLTGGGGSYFFGPFFSSSSDAPNSGAPFADFLLGYQSLVNGSQLLDWARQRDIYLGLYAQDDWKVTSRLTLNLGVRYDLYTQPVDAKDRGGLFNRELRRVVVPGENGFSRAIVDGDHNNFAPRFGLAYSATRRFTVRLGGGVFYARRDQNPEVTMMGTNIPNSPVIAFPQTSATGTLRPPVTINTQVAVLPSDASLAEFTPERTKSGGFRTADFKNSQAPYVYQWNLDLQYELGRNMVAELSYSGSKGNRLVNRVNDNQVSFEDAVAGRNRQVDRPIPYINGTNGVDTANGTSIYNAFNARLEKRYSGGLNFLANYTWSKNIESNGSGSSAFAQNGGTTYPLDSYNLWRERAVTPLDVPHVFVASYGYELPFGRGQRWLSENRLLGYALGNWQVNGITSLRSGFPTDIRSGRVPGNNMMYANFNVPDVVLGVPMYLPNRGVDGWFNPAAFAEPRQVRAANGVPITMYGNAGRRIARGPGSVNFDVSVFRNIPITERFRAQFRAEAFNVSNTPTFNLPGANSPSLTIGNPNFGKLASSSATGRQLQFALKLYF